MLKYGICGNMPNSSEEVNPLVNFAKPRVQEMLLQLNSAPCAKAELLRKWQDISEDIQKLLKLEVLQEVDGLVRVCFTLFSKEDKELVYAVSDKHAKTLAQKIAARKQDLHGMLAAYENKRLPVEKLAFTIVGCYLLDWGALDLMKSKELMDFGREQPGGNNYTLWAETDIAGSLKEIYWGGHSYNAGSYQLQTFGDHDAPRFAMPDILYRSPDWDFEGSRQFKLLLFDKRLELGEEMARMLESIGKGGAPIQQVKDGVQLPPERAEKILELLQTLGYIEVEDGICHLLIPYFDQRDLPMIFQAADIIGSLLRQWCEDNMVQLERDLAELNPLRNGVPFRELFIQVWHYVFGLANKYLAETGVIYDTYCPASRHKGYMPALSKGDVVQKLIEKIKLAE